MRVFLIVIFLLTFSCSGFAKEAASDSASSVHLGLVKRIVDYISNTNQPDTTKKFDISFIGGPYYSSEKKLGVGIVAAGLYHCHPQDSLASQVDLYIDVSITGFYKFGADGILYIGSAWHRLIYDVSYESMPDKYWGMGYDAGNNDNNETEYDRRQARIDCALLFRLPVANLYVGPHLSADYIVGSDLTDAVLGTGQRRHTFTASAGIEVEYDTRDSRYNAHKGMYVGLNQLFAPRFLGNKSAFSSTEISLNGYANVWKGGVLASRLHIRLTYGNTPWGLVSKLGGSYNMRGYWEGRYNDKCAADATIELRQRVYRRHGAVVWAGIGEVFRHPRSLFAGHALPNAGIGYRWEFKKDVDIRLDCGFGRHGYGIIFNLNEAF